MVKYDYWKRGSSYIDSKNKLHLPAKLLINMTELCS